jgi:hypothetical protein
MYPHVTLSALFPCTSHKLIIYNSGPIGKENFYDRAGVIKTAHKLVRFGYILCPGCYWQLVVHGSYKRHLKDALGERHNGWVAQGHCVNCNTYPSLIPDFIMPFKHYMGGVIEAVIEGLEGDGIDFSGCPADEATVQRWANQFNERGAQAAGWLISILFNVYGCFAGILEQQNKGQLKRLASLVQKIPAPTETSGVIGRANIVLTRHNVGFL